MTFHADRFGGICISVAGESVSECVEIAKQNEANADVIEIRLDTIRDAAVPPFLEAMRRPLLFTNRSRTEGGQFQGSEPDRLALLAEAVDHGAALVDLEVKTDDEFKRPLIAKAKAKGTGVILSWHHFHDTPSRQALESILQEQYKSGADIGKIVTTARDFAAVLRVLSLQTVAAEIGFPLIAFCMGPVGVISRVATLELNGYMTYAAPENARQTAPGQIPATTLTRILKDLRHGD